MDKEKLIAARKRLKEYQKSKKESTQENHSNQQNNVKNVEESNQVLINNDYSTIPIQNETYLPPTLEHNNTLNTMTASENSYNEVPLNSENYQNFTADNTFSKTECQSGHNQNFFAQINYEKPLESTEDKFQSNSETSNVVSNSAQHDGQMHAAITSIKDSFVTQKEQMLQMSSAIEDALKDKCENVVPKHDSIYQQTDISNSVDNNKMLTDYLQQQIIQYKNQILELENILATRDAEFQEKLSHEVKVLQEQIQIHAHTTNILVSEKAELNLQLNLNQNIIQQKIDEVKDLSDKLKTSQYRISELEKELLFIRSNNNDVQKACQQLQNRYDELSNQFSELRKVKEDMDLESSELKQKLNVKNNELTNLQQELQEKIALLSLSDLKIQQLTNSPQESQMIDNQRNTVVIYEQQIAQLKETIKNLTDEKSDAGKQYKIYVQQLDERHVELTTELETAQKRIAEFESREESYIQRLSDLEQQLQQEKSKIETLTPTDDYQTRMNVLTKNIDHLVLEQESLQTALTNKDAEIEQLKHQLQELQESKEEEVDASKLVTALESEQLGAARAVSQNQQLKNQLNEMHDAFVSLSNDKLELTEQVQAERNIGKKLNAMLNDVETQLEEVKQQLAEKEVALLEFEKEKLRVAQIEDQIQHYQAQSHHASTLQQELAKALSLIESLKKDNQRLNERFQVQSQSVINLEAVENTQQQISRISESMQEATTSSDIAQVNNAEINNVESTDIRIRKISTETQTSTQGEEDESFNIPEPFRKLEVKFKHTMEQVAELTDEKQKLEHLVLQLQGETETIGEYIKLYQEQRSILQERAREKEKSYKLLIEQRNQLQEQLHKLKVLVANFIQNKMKCSLNVDKYSVDNNNEDNAEVKVEGSQHSNIIEPSSIIDVRDKTTSEILDLLTEIKDCNDTRILEPDFHPCPWCSGKLITV